MRTGGVLTENCSGQGLHYFLEHLVSAVDTLPCLERLCLLGVDQYATVHLFQFLFSVLVGLYSTFRHLFAFWGELTNEGLPSNGRTYRGSLCGAPLCVCRYVG